MKNWLQNLKFIFLVSIVLAQGLFFISVNQVRADITNPIDTTKPAPTSLPKYNAGVDQSIKDYLCTPEGKGSDLFNCVNRLYRFSITAGVITLVALLIIAGYIYITSGEAGKTKAKSILLSGFTGMGIILTSFILLNFINPQLVNIKPIQPPIFESADLPKCEEIGFSADCIISEGGSKGQVFNAPTGKSGKAGCYNIEQGGCTKKTINACPEMAAQMDLALKVCNKESAGGNYSIKSSSDNCREQTTKDALSFSIGLWQINMLNSAGDFPECKDALKHVSPGKECKVYSPYSPDQCTCKYGPKGRAGYDACVAALQNPETNTKAACKLFNSPRPNNWGRWGTSYNKCK